MFRRCILAAALLVCLPVHAQLPEPVARVLAEQRLKPEAFGALVLRGDDLVLANKYGHDRDDVSGGTGFDKINVADGDKRDTASGGKGRDSCIVDARREVGTGCSKVTIR